LSPDAEKKALPLARQQPLPGMLDADFPFNSGGERVGRVVYAGQQIYNAAFSHVSTSLSRAFLRQKSRFDLNSAQLSSS
jgi:hypothetical protein